MTTLILILFCKIIKKYEKQKTMKTFQLLTLTLFLSLTTFTNAQSEQETIEWLENTIETYYAGGQISNLEIDACKLRYVVDDYLELNKPILIDKLKCRTVDGKVQITYDGINASIKYNRNDKKKSLSDFFISLLDDGSGLEKRVMKALRHLSTFCKSKNEPF
jgi:hypothetical protein